VGKFQSVDKTDHRHGVTLKKELNGHSVLLRQELRTDFRNICTRC